MILSFLGVYIFLPPTEERENHTYALGQKSSAGSLVGCLLRRHWQLICSFFGDFLSNAFLCFPKLVSFSSPNIAESIRKLGKEELKPPLCPHAPVVLLQSWRCQTLCIEKPLLRMLQHPYIFPEKQEWHLREGAGKWDHFVPHSWVWWSAVGVILRRSCI